MIIVCKDCPKRKLNCHAKCKLYLTEKKIHDEERKKKKNEALSRQLAGGNWGYDPRSIKTK